MDGKMALCCARKSQGRPWFAYGLEIRAALRGARQCARGCGGLDIVVSQPSLVLKELGVTLYARAAL